MKKTILILSLLLACAFTAQAQDYIKEGDALFTAGKYAEAKRKYEGYNLVNQSSPHATRRIEQCDKCLLILPVADYLYSEGDYAKARAEYEKILAMNPSDPTARARVRQIDAQYSDNTTDKGVTINGVTWATRNVDSPGTFAARPEDAGMFYQWNRRKGWPATGTVSGWDDSTPSGDRWSRANDPCPAGWRVPTVDELKLLDEVYSEWTTVNGVSGRRFGYGSNSIFLPASGYRNLSTGNLDNVGTYGYYWSCSPYNSGNGYYLGFGSSSVYPTGNGSRTYGFSVRCVRE